MVSLPSKFTKLANSSHQTQFNCVSTFPCIHLCHLTYNRLTNHNVDLWIMNHENCINLTLKGWLIWCNTSGDLLQCRFKKLKYLEKMEHRVLWCPRLRLKWLIEGSFSRDSWKLIVVFMSLDNKWMILSGILSCMYINLNLNRLCTNVQTHLVTVDRESSNLPAYKFQRLYKNICFFCSFFTYGTH